MIIFQYFSIYRRALLTHACPCNKMSLTCLWSLVMAGWGGAVIKTLSDCVQLLGRSLLSRVLIVTTQDWRLLSSVTG